MPTSDPYWRMKELFAAALEKPPAERDVFLQAECADDPRLLKEINDLLMVHDQSHSLEVPPSQSPPSHPVERAGDVIGQYKLLQVIGEGGFGMVYMAEQDQPVRRRVALKIIKLGMDTRQVIARFEAERQALAMMDHAGVAKVFDAGATASGRPYFVMELVKGVPVTEYCDKNNLSIAQRLDLFMQVCLAVHHAHQKGLIHRDIKPSNVMVSTQDDKPVVKVIDFGIAKATQAKLTAKTLFTEFQQLIGTPEYMSPEQAEGSLDVDTRSDLYSLGVLLYELLTGTTPCDARELRSKAYAEIQRIIREVEPPKPSTRLSQNTDTIAGVAAHRRSEPRKLTANVRGELDWIVMKCLEKQRSRRYESASGLAMDVQRYLNDEPVAAGPPSARYRFGKFARRHKAGLAVGLALAMAALLAVTGLVANNLLVRREKNQKEAALARVLQEKERADQNLARARKAVNYYLTRVSQNELLKEADFHQLRRDLLESAVPFYEEFIDQKSNDPELEAERGRALGDLALVREELDDFDQALSANEQRRAVFERLVVEHPSVPAYRHEVANCFRNIGNVQMSLDRHASAEPAFRQAVTMLEALATEYPATAPYRQDLAGAYSNLGILLRGLGRLDESLQLQQKAVILRERLAAEPPASSKQRRDFAQSLSNLSSIFSNLSRHDEALKANRRAEELCRALAEENPRTSEYREMWGMSLDNQSVLLCDLGRRDEGLAALKSALAINEKLAADFPSVPRHRYGLSQTLVNECILMAELGRHDDGLAASGRAVVILTKMVDESPNVPQYRHMLAAAYTNQADLRRRLNRNDEALADLRQAVKLQERLVADDPSSPRLRDYLATSYGQMGENLAVLGRYDEAAAVFEQGLPIREQLARESPSVPAMTINLGGIYASIGDLKLEQHQLEASVQWFDKALTKLTAVLEDEPRASLAQRYAGLTYSSRAMALSDLDRNPEALKDLEKALALNDVENRVELRLQRAKTMAHLRMHTDATAEADQIAAIPDLAAHLLQEAAGVYAVCSEQVREDAQLSERYAARAVALLGGALEKDYRGLVDGVAKDKDLDILRARDDFKNLMKERERK